MEIAIDNEDEVQALQFGMCHDDELLTIESEDVILTDDFPATTFVGIVIHDEPGESGWTIGTICGVFGCFETILPGTDLVILEATYALIGAGESTLEFCGTLGSPFVTVAVVVSGGDIEPVVENGIVAIDPPFAFLRGDANGDGEVMALTDAIFLLEWAFVAGEPPPCMRAADIDDSGSVDALPDVLALVAFGFLNGAEPPLPGAQDCGQDPTDDDLLCGEDPGCL